MKTSYTNQNRQFRNFLQGGTYQTLKRSIQLIMKFEVYYTTFEPRNRQLLYVGLDEAEANKIFEEVKGRIRNLREQASVSLLDYSGKQILAFTNNEQNYF